MRKLSKKNVVWLFFLMFAIFACSNGYGKNEFRVKRVVIDLSSHIYAMWQEDNSPQQATLFHAGMSESRIKKIFLQITFSDKLTPYLSEPPLTLEQIRMGVHKHSKRYLYPMSWSLFNRTIYPIYFVPNLEPMTPHPSRAFGIAKYRFEELDYYKVPRNYNSYWINNLN